VNRLAEFVYTVATAGHRRKTPLIIFGLVFWYGGVALMVSIAPLVDKWCGFSLQMASALRFATGAVLTAAGTPLVVWSIFQCFRARGTPVPFKPPPGLITTGIYGFVRNPMHLGWTLFLYGISVFMQSLTLLVIFLPLFILAHILYIKLVEEKELEKKYGQAYADYKKHVPMLIPEIKRN